MTEEIPEDYYIKGYPMNNEGNTGVEKERIEKEADQYCLDNYGRHTGSAYEGYIAGATVERERYIAALKELIPIAEATRIMYEPGRTSLPGREQVESAIDNAKKLIG